jgi:hypothetical protein
MLIRYLAKVHNESFMKQVEFASALWHKEETQPSVGTARGPHHVRWRQSRKSRSCTMELILQRIVGIQGNAWRLL